MAGVMKAEEYPCLFFFFFYKNNPLEDYTAVSKIILTGGEIIHRSKPYQLAL